MQNSTFETGLNIGALRFVWGSRNNETIKSLFVAGNYGSGLTAPAIKTKQAVFPWELKMCEKYRVYEKSKLLN